MSLNGTASASASAAAAVAKALVETTEAAINDEIHRYDSLLEGGGDDGERAALDRLRARRLRELKEEHGQRQKWHSLGHGRYGELGEGSAASGDIAKAFFEAARQSERLVVHFCRPTSANHYGEVFDGHLEALARKHVETRFVKVDCGRCESEPDSPTGFLVERLGIVVMPTLLLVLNRKAVHQVRGFDELGGDPDNLETSDLETLLALHRLVRVGTDVSPDDLSTVGGAGGIGGIAKGVNRINLTKTTKMGKASLKPLYDDEN